MDEALGVNESASAILAQLEYLVDELSAQLPLFEQISAEILNERPGESGQSIADYYGEMLEREEGHNARFISKTVS